MGTDLLTHTKFRSGSKPDEGIGEYKSWGWMGAKPGKDALLVSKCVGWLRGVDRAGPSQVAAHTDMGVSHGGLGCCICLFTCEPRMGAGWTGLGCSTHWQELELGWARPGQVAASND